MIYSTDVICYVEYDIMTSCLVFSQPDWLAQEYATILIRAGGWSTFTTTRVYARVRQILCFVQVFHFATSVLKKAASSQDTRLLNKSLIPQHVITLTLSVTLTDQLDYDFNISSSVTL